MQHTLSPEQIRALPLFSGLTEQDKDSLLQEGQMRRYTRGQSLFFHGDPVAHFYIVLSGTVQLYRESPEGKEKTIEMLKAGQTICEGEILDSCRAHRASAEAVDAVTVLEFTQSWLKEASRKHGMFALNLLSSIAAQAHLAEVEAEHQATMSAAQLVACFLQRLCVLYDFDHKGFELPYSKTLIASRLGMELETFSRTLARLKEQGIVVEGTHVAITDLAAVEQYVCGFCSISEECPTHRAMERIAAI